MCNYEEIRIARTSIGYMVWDELTGLEKFVLRALLLCSTRNSAKRRNATESISLLSRANPKRAASGEC